MTAHRKNRRKDPSQQRSEATIRAIMEACMLILEREGCRKLNTNRIAEVAGVSIGSLYQYYPDKHAIIADVCNELLLTGR